MAVERNVMGYYYTYKVIIKNLFSVFESRCFMFIRKSLKRQAINRQINSLRY